MVDVTDVDENATATTGIGDPESTVLVSVDGCHHDRGRGRRHVIVRLSGKVSSDLSVEYRRRRSRRFGDFGHTTMRNHLQAVPIPAGMTSGRIDFSYDGR